MALLEFLEFYVVKHVLAGCSSDPKDSSSLLTMVAKVAKKDEQRYSLPCLMNT